jgi:hypothetical protein
MTHLSDNDHEHDLTFRQGSWTWLVCQTVIMDRHTTRTCVGDRHYVDMKALLDAREAEEARLAALWCPQTKVSSFCVYVSYFKAFIFQTSQPAQKKSVIIILIDVKLVASSGATPSFLLLISTSVRYIINRLTRTGHIYLENCKGQYQLRQIIN